MSQRKSLSLRTREDALKVFNVPSRYVIQDVLGQGAYGIVVSAKDSETNQIVAVKKIEKVFDHETFTKRTLREIRILKLLKHENIISMKSVFTTAKDAKFDDLYLVFDLMETDLANIIKSPQPLSGHHIQFFLYQILRGLKFLHSAGIIHRDIKPRNLLVNSNCDLKICDMGLARFDSGDLTNCPPMTDYVATRWYRAPEIILQWEGYNKAIDLWAVGCILAELIGRKPIFPGQEADHQITLICEVLGRPSSSLIQRCPHPETIQFLEALPKKPVNPLTSHHLYRQADIVAIDLLTKLLRFDPDRRFTVNECLKHPYLQQLHCPQDEPESELLDLLRDFPFDAEKGISAEKLHEIVVNEIKSLGSIYENSGETDFVKESSDEIGESSDDVDVPRPPSVSPPPVSPPYAYPLPPPINSNNSHKPDTSSNINISNQKSNTSNKNKKPVSLLKPTSTSSSHPQQYQQPHPPSKRGVAKHAVGIDKGSRPRNQRGSAKVSGDESSPALVVHSPILESSQDALIVHSPKTPSTPSNVSLELGRLGAAIDELRAM